MIRKRNLTTEALLHDPTHWQKLLVTYPEAYWIHRGQIMARSLWKKMKCQVPAYKKFLVSHNVRVSSISSQKQWDRIPLIDKDSYLRKYPLPLLMWLGRLTDNQLTIASTSGSTGEPFYFPRTHIQNEHYAAIAEMYLRTNFSIHKRSTLYIIGWGMGVWIGGVFSYEVVRMVAQRGTYALSVITPGTSKEEILKAVKSLGPFYDQVIIGGYPPMIKDLVDEGVRQGLSWRAYHIKFIFSAEGFSEIFRDYIYKHAGLRNIYMDTLNHYGTVDLGTMAHETPVSILVRRIALNNTKLNERLFGHSVRQPTFAQYIPELFFFEEVQKSVVCSAYSGIPLVRYDLLDTGGVISFEDVRRICRECGVHLGREIRRAGISSTIWNLPFVYVSERRDFTVKWQGANIYLQEVRRALEVSSFERVCTGKCTLSTGYDKKMNQTMTIVVELCAGVRKTNHLVHKIQSQVVRELLVSNSEYAYLSKQLTTETMTPIIDCRPYGDSPLFSAAGKHQWIRK